jgi:hypothetical protein
LHVAEPGQRVAGALLERLTLQHGAVTADRLLQNEARPGAVLQNQASCRRAHPGAGEISRR